MQSQEVQVADAHRSVKEKEDTLKIEMGKKYRMVGTHEPVRIICVDRFVKEGCVPVIALLKDRDTTEQVIYLELNGCNYYGRQRIEEVPAVDWGKVKVDTPIWIRYGDNPWRNRHFKKFDRDFVYFWPHGTTSFTCENPYDDFVPESHCSLDEPK